MPAYLEGVLISLHATQIAEPEGYGKKGSTKQAKAAFADGTALPAKRPRTSNIADPDAARSNKRVPAITDFFNSIPSDTKPVSKASDTAASPDAQPAAKLDQHSIAEPSRIPDAAEPLSKHEKAALPATINHHAKVLSVKNGADAQLTSRITGSGGDGEPSAERKRQILADAAVHRLTAQQHHASEPAAQLSLPSTSATHPEAVQEGVSLSTLHEVADLDATGPGDAAHVSAVIDLVHDDHDELGMQQGTQKGENGPAQAGASSQQPSCPICGETWPRQTSNAQMNDHVDICLRMQLL